MVEFSFPVPQREDNEAAQLTVCQACMSKSLYSNNNVFDSQLLKYRKCYYSTAYTYAFISSGSVSVFNFLFYSLLTSVLHVLGSVQD